MSPRLTNVITATGDDGRTSLANGSRVAKDSLRIAAIGDVDELNSVLGVLLAEPMPEIICVQLFAIQNDLFEIGAILALCMHDTLPEARVIELTQQAELLNAKLPVLQEFILPGGTRAAALAHQVRAVCRRAERALVALAHQEPLPELALLYLNRLSDYMFILARFLNLSSEVSDLAWQPEHP